MSDYSYIVGAFFGLSLFLVMLANMGAADDIYGDDFIVIDGQEYTDSELEEMDYDFDIERVRFSMEEDPTLDVRPQLDFVTDAIYVEEVEADDEGSAVWTGQTNEFGEDEGYLVLDISDRERLGLRFSDSAWWGSNIQWYAGASEYDESQPPWNQTDSERFFVGAPTDEIDVTSCGEDSDEQCQWLGIVLLDEDSSVESVGDPSDEEFLTGVGSFQTINSILTSLFNLLTGIPSVLYGYLVFAAAVPGMMGTVLRLYIGILVLAVIAKEIWL